MPIDYSRLDPDFCTKLRGFEGACKAHGLDMRAREGWRDPARSQALYEAWIASGKKGPRAAPAGKSAHNYGLAVDYLCFDPNGQQIGTSLAPEYALMEEIAPRFGLRTLRSLNDGGHVELDGWEDRIKFSDVVGGSSTIGPSGQP